MSEQLSILPAQQHSATSRAAAQKAKKRAASQRSLILGFIQANGPVTDDQIQMWLGIDGNAERPRRVKLEEDGLIEKCDDLGITRKGNRAARWVVKGFKREGSK